MTKQADNNFSGPGLDALAEIWPDRWMQRAVFISKKYHYVYVANPKVGCTTIKEFLARAELEDPTFKHEHIHQRRNNPLLRPMDLSIPERHRVMSEEFYRFTFVRHPMKRTISAYLRKMRSKKDHPRKRKILEVLGYGSKGDWTKISFEEFLTALCRQDPLEMDPHWQPQVLVTGFSKMNFDLVGKLEEFDQEMSDLCATLSLPDYMIEKRNVRRRSVDLESLITPRARRLVKEIYREDFEAFGYEMEGR